MSESGDFLKNHWEASPSVSLFRRPDAYIPGISAITMQLLSSFKKSVYKRKFPPKNFQDIQKSYSIESPQ